MSDASQGKVRDIVDLAERIKALSLAPEPDVTAILKFAIAQLCALALASDAKAQFSSILAGQITTGIPSENSEEKEQ
jgi:hypothetical protein